MKGSLAPRSIGGLVFGAVVSTGSVGMYRLYQKMRAMRPDQQQGPIDPNEALRGKGQFASAFYEGGFEEKMSKREAALILGCRETANKEKILTRYRTLMKVNHPDLGGSPFLSSKINEAKELLSKTARAEDDRK